MSVRLHRNLIYNRAEIRFFRSRIYRMSPTYHGSCLCRSVKITVEGEPKRVYVCYCGDCRKNSGHLGQINVPYDVEDVTVEDPDGVVGEYVVRETLSGKPKHKFFCGRCGCTIRTVCESIPGKTIVRVMNLDDADGRFVPEEALFAEEKVRYTGGVQSEFF